MNESEREQENMESYEADARHDAEFEKTKLATRIAADQAGLVLWVNEDGEDEFLGTPESWKEFTKLKEEN